MARRKIRPSYGSTEYTNTMIGVAIVLGAAATGRFPWEQAIPVVIGLLGLHNVGRAVVKARAPQAPPDEPPA